MSGLNHCSMQEGWAVRTEEGPGETEGVGGLRLWAALLKKHVGMWVKMGHNKTEVST